MYPNWTKAQQTASQFVADWSAAREPGGAIVAFDREALRVIATGGLANPATGVPFGIDTVVRYASVTKHIFVNRLLAHAEFVRLDDRLGDHLPMLRGAMAAVTVGRALDMSGGLPDVRETLGALGIPMTSVLDDASVLAFVGRLAALNFPAGQEISYSNTGYRLVEAALAAKGLPFQALVSEEINAALGTGFYAPDTWAETVPRLAPGYVKSGGAWQQTTAGLHLSASGSLTGSALDLACWLQAVLNDTGPANGLIAAQGAQRLLADGRPTGYGLGLTRNTLDGVTLFGHGGSHAGYKSQFFLEPISGTGVAVVSNRDDTATSIIAQSVLAAMLGLALPERSTAIPDGLYASETGPYWLNVTDGIATYLGAAETLYQGAQGTAVSLSAHLPMTLAWTGTAIEGEIGHAERRFVPVTPGADLDFAAGRWECPAHHAWFDIAGDTLSIGIGPARQQAKLVSIGGKRLLATVTDGPWSARRVLAFSGDRVTITLNRSRVLVYERRP